MNLYDLLLHQLGLGMGFAAEPVPNAALKAIEGRN